MAAIGTDIEHAKQLLEQGKLVAIPTETVYGLAANALDASAVASIFEVKNRPTFDPLIVHVPDVEALDLFAIEVPEMAYALAARFWPGPLTLLLKKRTIIPDLVTSGLDTVGLRCPDHPVTSRLLASLSFPLAAPSANPFGYVSPTTPEHVQDQLGDAIGYILDGGACRVGVESTIVSIEDDSLVVHRLGGLPIESLQTVDARVIVRPNSTSRPLAPGQLESHYSPRKRLLLGNISALLQHHNPETVGVLSYCTDYHVPNQILLSPTSSLTEAAKNLFGALRSLDKMPVDMILAEPVPDHGLGRAINDRLRRAAVQ